MFTDKQTGTKPCDCKLTEKNRMKVSIRKGFRFSVHTFFSSVAFLRPLRPPLVPVQQRPVRPPLGLLESWT